MREAWGEVEYTVVSPRSVYRKSHAQSSSKNHEVLGLVHTLVLFSTSAAPSALSSQRDPSEQLSHFSTIF